MKSLLLSHEFLNIPLTPGRAQPGGTTEGKWTCNITWPGVSDPEVAPATRYPYKVPRAACDQVGNKNIFKNQLWVKLYIPHNL